MNPTLSSTTASNWDANTTTTSTPGKKRLPSPCYEVILDTESQLPFLSPGESLQGFIRFNWDANTASTPGSKRHPSPCYEVILETESQLPFFSPGESLQGFIRFILSRSLVGINSISSIITSKIIFSLCCGAPKSCLS